MPSPRRRRRPGVLPALGLVAACLLTTAAHGDGPADPLLKLVPGNSGVTLAVEDLRGHAHALLGSPWMRGLRQLPAVRRLQATPGFQEFRRSLDRVEALLDAEAATIRDSLLGDAVVLALWLPPGAPPESARGLLLAKPSDRALLERFVSRLNTAQADAGELKRVTDRKRGEVVYHVREFMPGMKVDESYVIFDDGVFVWSNSEELLQSAIDRRSESARGGLSEVPGFRAVRGRLPTGALMSLFVDPRFAERLLSASPRPQTPRDQRIAAAIGRYVGALSYVGAALAWRDGPVLHTEEVVDPTKLPPALRRWAARPEPPEPRLTRVPPNTLGVASAHLDVTSLVDAFHALTPEADLPSFENLMLALRGGLLGLDPRDEVAAHLGPGASLHVERPTALPDDAGRRPPVVLTVQIASTPAGARAAAAVENGLRTLLALAALDPKNGRGRLRVESQTEGAAVITYLLGTQPLAFTVHDGRVLVGTSPAAVRRALAAQADPTASALVERLRSLGMPAATTFAGVDLRALHAFADPHRKALAARIAAREHRPEADAARDLDEALALVHLFDAVYVASTIDRDFTRVHRAIGLPIRRSDAP